MQGLVVLCMQGRVAHCIQDPEVQGIQGRVGLDMQDQVALVTPVRVGPAMPRTR